MLQNKIYRFALLSALIVTANSVYAAPQAELVAALTKSKLTLADGIRYANKDGGVAVSAKFEFDDGGKLSLSLYSATKGLKVSPDDNVLQEMAGSPEQAQWKPEIEVFKDVPHIARSSEHLTLMALSKLSLLNIINKTKKSHPGIVFSITPEIKQHQPVAVVLLANRGKTTELTYNLLDGKLIKSHQL